MWPLILFGLYSISPFLINLPENTKVIKKRKKIFKLKIPKIPVISWPTVVLVVLSSIIYISSLYMYINYIINWGASFILSTIGCYISFTPMHEAVHLSVSKKYPWINSLVGWISSIPFLFSYNTFRIVHLSHHKYTNHSQLDPDYFSSGGNPLKLAFTSSFYNAYMIKFYPKSNITITVIFSFLYVFYIYYLRNDAIIVCILLPLLTSSIFIGYIFDYFPHKPHDSEDIYKCAKIIKGPFLRYISFNQSMHAVHHIFPYIPFYMYGTIYDIHRNDFLQEGVIETEIF